MQDGTAWILPELRVATASAELGRIQALQQIDKAVEEGTSSLFAAGLHLWSIGAGGLLLLARAL